MHAYTLFAAQACVRYATPGTAWSKTVKQMRIVVTHYGGPEALQVLEEECPEQFGPVVWVAGIDPSLHKAQNCGPRI